MSNSTPTPDAPRLLVAHRHSLTRLFLADNLTADGYPVLTAADRAETIAALDADSQIAALVLDLGADTEAILDHLAELDSDRHPQVVVLSDDRDPVNRARLLRQGADEFIGEPFAYPELHRRISERLQRRFVTGHSH